MKPYVVRPEEPGLAAVLDRTSRRPLGIVLARFRPSWETACAVDASEAHWVTVCRLRSEAVEAVWQHAQRCDAREATT